jgi:hypothetical protein
MFLGEASAVFPYRNRPQPYISRTKVRYQTVTIRPLPSRLSPLQRSFLDPSSPSFWPFSLSSTPPRTAFPALTRLFIPTRFPSDPWKILGLAFTSCTHPEPPRPVLFPLATRQHNKLPGPDSRRNDETNQPHISHSSPIILDNCSIFIFAL